MRFLSPLLSILLAPLMASAPLLAQAPALGSSVGATPDTVGAALQLRMTKDESGSAVAGSRSVKGFTVEVTDPAGAPVQNAAVVFRLPDSGPSAKFADGSLAAVAYTDAQGRANVKNIQWDSVPGTVAVRITAVKDTMHAGLLFEENLTTISAAPISQAMPVMPRQIESIPAQAVPIARVPAVVVENRSAQPGELPSQRPVVNTFTADNDSPEANVPVRRMAGTADGGGGEEPGVSITTSGAASRSGGHSKLKWILIAAVAAGGAGAALAFVHKGSSSSSSGVTIGSPSVSVGNP